MLERNYIPQGLMGSVQWSRKYILGEEMFWVGSWRTGPGPEKSGFYLHDFSPSSFLTSLWHLTLWAVYLFLNFHLLWLLMATLDSGSLAALSVCSWKFSLLLALECRLLPSQSLRPAAGLLWFQPSKSQNSEVRITWGACEKCKIFWHHALSPLPPPHPTRGML